MNKKNTIKRYCQTCGEAFNQAIHGGLFNNFKCYRCRNRGDKEKHLTPDQYADNVLKSLPKDKDIY